VSDTNPYLEARREWNDRYADLSRATRNWQIVAAAALAADLILASGIVWLAERRVVVPYVVAVDKLGYALAAGAAKREDEALAADKVVRYHLAAFIRGARSVIADPVALKRTLDQVYAYARGPAVSVLDGYYRASNPFEQAKKTTVSVDVQSLLLLSERTWQVRWTEMSRSLDGSLAGRTAWEAVLTVETIPPASDEAMLANPTGLYVVGLSWTRQL
jgi:type IV secretion system protein VirB5